MSTDTGDISIGLLGVMAKAAYDGNPTTFTSGWETVRTFRLGHCFSVLFCHTPTARFVLANRGSDVNLNSDDGAPMDWVNNATMMLTDQLLWAKGRDAVKYGLWTVLRKHARDTLLQACAIVGPREFVLTGHSQGGLISMLQAATRRLPAVVFNTMSVRFADRIWDRTDPNRFINVRFIDDIAAKATTLNKGRSILLPLENDWPGFSGALDATVEVALNELVPLLGGTYSGYKLVRAVRQSVRSHLLSTLLPRLQGEPTFQANLGWLEQDGPSCFCTCLPTCSPASRCSPATWKRASR